MIEILPAIVPQSFDEILASAEKYAGRAPAIHLDGTDGIFTPHTTWLPDEGSRLPTMISFEAHLMLGDPVDWGIRYAKAGATRIIAHIEAFPDRVMIPAAFDAWKSAGAQHVGLAAKFDTRLEVLAPYLPLCDTVLCMTISSIGTQGNPFVPESLDRIRALRELSPYAKIAVDGGITEDTIPSLVQAGVHRICVGAALAGPDSEAVYKRLQEAAETVY